MIHTTEEWAAAADPEAMLKWLRHPYKMVKDGRFVNGVSRRQLRLIACACARVDWAVFSPRQRRAVEVAEDYADGAATKRLLANAHRAAERVQRRLWEACGAGQLSAEWGDSLWPVFACQPDGALADTLRDAVTGPHHADLIREIVGDPFDRPFSFWWVVTAAADMSAAALDSGAGEESVPAVPWLRWRDGAVVRFARSAYDRRAFDDLAVMADLLEDAGCDDAGLVNHFRPRRCPYCADATFAEGDSGAPIGFKALADHNAYKCVCKGTKLVRHVRGCHALDRILGKE